MNGLEFEFGERVTFSRTLARRWQEGGRKVWQVGQAEPSPRRGIVIGVRVLTDGRNEYGGYDEPIVYHAERRFRAFVVAYDMRRRPVLVLPEDIKPINPKTLEGDV